MKRKAVSLWVASLLACAAGLTQGQTAPSTARSHAPRALPLTKFYDTPSPLRAGKPGELIRSEPFDDYDLPNEISAVRILYHSRNAAGDDVAVSGVVLVPDAKPPAAGWPIIAWAHDFAGSARACAPSLQRNLSAGPLLAMYPGVGYAVVASDYAGLGTNSPAAILDMQSNALDVIHSIPAARTAVPGLGSRWIAAGNSQGAVVAVGVAEAESGLRDPNYLGAVAISGVADAADLFERQSQGPSYRGLVFLAQGIKAIFPEFKVEEMLAEKAIPLYRHVQQACDLNMDLHLSAAEMLKPGWENNRYVKEFFARNTPGQKPAFGPILVIGADADPNAPSKLTAVTVTRMCSQGDRVVFYQYPEVDASAVVGTSVSDQLSWIRARFAGHPAPSNCR